MYMLVLPVSRTTIVIVFIFLFDTIYTIHQTDSLSTVMHNKNFNSVSVL